MDGKVVGKSDLFAPQLKLVWPEVPMLQVEMLASVQIADLIKST